jgi:hypothetical protein
MVAEITWGNKREKERQGMYTSHRKQESQSKKSPDHAFKLFGDAGGYCERSSHFSCKEVDLLALAFCRFLYILHVVASRMTTIIAKKLTPIVIPELFKAGPDFLNSLDAILLCSFPRTTT